MHYQAGHYYIMKVNIERFNSFADVLSIIVHFLAVFFKTMALNYKKKSKEKHCMLA